MGSEVVGTVQEAHDTLSFTVGTPADVFTCLQSEQCYRYGVLDDGKTQAEWQREKGQLACWLEWICAGSSELNEGYDGV